ncbi:RDD family protein [Helicobacter sp. 23-1045]
MNLMDILDREGLKIASDERRILAFFIDEIIISLIIFVGFFGELSTLRGDVEQIQTLLSNAFLYIFALQVAYHSIFTALYGASLGKIICKIKIVKIDTLDKPNALDAVLRSLIRIISTLLLYIPFLVAFGDTFRRAMHDLIIKTIVIDIRQEIE